MRWPWQRRKALTASPEVVNALSTGDFNPYPQLGSGAAQRIRAAFNTAVSGNYDAIWRSSPSVRTVIDLISRNMAQLDLNLFEEVGPNERQPADHPATDLLRYPNPSQSTNELVLTLTQEFCVFGNAYALVGLNPVGNTPYVIPLSATRMEVMGEAVIAPAFYRYHYPLTGAFRDFPAESVFHWRTWNSCDPRIGISPLETLRGLIGEEAAIIQANSELAQAGTTGPMWISRPPEAAEWSVEARERFRGATANRLRQTNREPLILDEGMEIHGLGVSPRDAQMFEVRRMIQERIAAEFGVQPPMVGLDGDLEKAQSAFYADVLPPMAEQLAYQLTRAVMVNLYARPDYCFAFDIDEKLLGDERLKALTSAAGVPPLTRNEARAMLNLPPVDGGDEPITPMNVIVGDNPKPSPQVMPIQDPNEPPQDGSYRQNGVTTGGVATSNGRKALDTGSVPMRIALVRRQSTYINEAQDVLQKYADRLVRSMSSGKAFDSTRWNAELKADLLPHIRSVFEREGSIQASHLGGSFDPAYVRNYTAAMAEEIAAGFNDGASKRLAEFGSDAKDWIVGEHVSMFATSIGARAAVKARNEAAKQSPSSHLRLQTWVADTERHADLDGVSVPLDSDWGGISPGSEPNCACTAAIN